MFWTALTFLLSAPPFGYSVSAIGLVGLAGLAGALVARGAGRLHDRGLSVPVTGAALALALVPLSCWPGVGQTSIVVLLIAILAFDIAAQASLILNQTRLLSIDPAARSRMNTAFVTGNFIGGAVGSALAGRAVAGRRLVPPFSSAAQPPSLIALLVWATHRHTLTNAAHI